MCLKKVVEKRRNGQQLPKEMAKNPSFWFGLLWFVLMWFSFGLVYFVLFLFVLLYFVIIFQRFGSRKRFI